MQASRIAMMKRHKIRMNAKNTPKFEKKLWQIVPKIVHKMGMDLV